MNFEQGAMIGFPAFLLPESSLCYALTRYIFCAKSLSGYGGSHIFVELRYSMKKEGNYTWIIGQ